jgi:hypothetical protein
MCIEIPVSFNFLLSFPPFLSFPRCTWKYLFFLPFFPFFPSGFYLDIYFYFEIGSQRVVQADLELKSSCLSLPRIGISVRPVPPYLAEVPFLHALFNFFSCVKVMGTSWCQVNLHFPDCTSSHVYWPVLSCLVIYFAHFFY